MDKFEREMDEFNKKSANMNYKIIQKYVRIELNEFQKFIEYHQNQDREKIKEEITYLDHDEIIITSIIISLIILLEINLREFLEDYQDNRDLKISHKELRGDILKKFKVYSQKVLNLNFDFNSDLWQYINGLNEVRNCLIHNQGWLDEYHNRKIIEDFVKKEKTISIDKNDFLDISFETCENAIKEIDRFFITICKIGINEYPGEFDIDNDQGYYLPIKD